MKAPAAGRAGFTASLCLLAGLALWLGPRPIHEPWLAEEVGGSRAGSLGLEGLLARRLADPSSIRAAAAASGIRGDRLPAHLEGAQLFDADGDGLMDLFIPRLDEVRGTASRFYFYLNDGSGGLREVGKLLGAAFTRPRRARETACGDLDQDGRMDVAVRLEDGSYVVLWNRLEQKDQKDRRED